MNQMVRPVFTFARAYDVKGTKQFGPGVLTRMVSQQGGKQNAGTSDDFTFYYQMLSADQLELSFKLEADRMHHLLLAKNAFEQEKKVVMEERRTRVDDNPQGLAWERFRAAAFINNPYRHPVIGWMTDLKHMTVADVQRWYQAWYAPNNAVVVVVGDVKPDHVYLLAKKYFEPIKAVHLPKLKPRTEVPSLGERHVTVNVPAKLPLLIMGYNVPTLPSLTKPEQKTSYALALAATLLSSGDSARLKKEVVRKKQVAVSAYAHYDLYSLHQNVFVLGGVPVSSQYIPRLKAALLAQIQRLKTHLVSQKELDRVKVQLIANKVYRKDSLMRQAFHIGIPEMVGLSWRDSDSFIENINAVTPAEVRDVIRTYFTNENLTVTELKPFVPPVKQVIKKVKDDKNTGKK